MKPKHHSVIHLMQLFDCDHLPEGPETDLAGDFEALAETVSEGPPNPETSVALRKLSESKKAALAARVLGDRNRRYAAILEMGELMVYDHLPTHLADISKPFCVLARVIASGPRNEMAYVAMLRIWEAKNSAVDAVVIGTQSTAGHA